MSEHTAQAGAPPERGPLRIDILTIFPNLLAPFLGESIMKRAAQSGAVEFRPVNLRDYATDKHQTTDDRPYGGGPGMVMLPAPIFKAVGDLRDSRTRVILTSPAGRTFNQRLAEDLAREKHLLIICGHYEGVDERVRTALVDDELSIGDYVLTHGVLPAAVIIDAVVRLLPGVLGGAGATIEESFNDGRLEYPHYTRPAEFQGLAVPEVLLSGDHAAIAAWRREQSLQRTRDRRPDLLNPPPPVRDDPHPQA